MTKTKIYTLIFAILIALVAFTYYNKYAKEKNAKKFKTFKIEEFKDITLIKMSDTNDKKMTLKKTEKGWILNDKYPVRKHLFEEMKKALTKMEAFHPAPYAAQENAITEILSHDIKVEIYEGKDKPSKIIHVGGPNATATATYMILEIDGITSPLVYEVGIPGFRGFLTGRFLINEKEWRSKELFSYSPDEVKELSIQYSNDKDNSFVLQKEKDFILEFNDKKIIGKKLNEKAIVNLLLSLENQSVMSYDLETAEEEPFKDSIFITNKFAEIKIVDQENNIKRFTIVKMPINERTLKQYDSEGYPMNFDSGFKYVVMHPNNDWGVVSVENIDKLLINPKSLVNVFTL